MLKKALFKKTTLKRVVSLSFIIVLSACSSQPAENSFVGAGDFNAQEAAKTRVSLGLTYLKNGNFSQAKFNLDKALEFAPRSGEAHYAMAFYYQQVDEVARAEEYYQSAIGYSRNDPDVLNSYGAFLCKQGQYAKAKDYFLQAVDDKSYIDTAQTYENLAICAQNQGLKEEAKNYFNAALNHQPTRASTHFFLAQNYIDAQNWAEAKKALWKYERNARVSADSLWMSYQIAKGENNLKGAIEYADILKRLHPNHANTTKAMNELGKFQPTMEVTQKGPTSPAASNPTNVSASIDSNELTTQTTSKVNKVLAPQLDKPTDALESATTVEAQLETQLANAPDLAEQKPQFHVVLPKENLYRISLKYNVKMKKLLEWNNLTDAASIRIGTKLRVRDPNTNE